MRVPFTQSKHRQQMHFLPVTAAIPAQIVLSNEDLVDIIATFCSRSSLASFIRVSWACFDICKKRLWKITPSIFNVLILLPFLEFREGHWTLEPRKTPPPSWEWTRFDLYAPHIRQFISLGCSSVLGRPDIDTYILSHLTFSRPEKFFNSPIFPALQVLSISADDFGNAPPCSVEHLYTNRLRDVEIQATYSPIQPYLEDLIMCAKNIRSLTIIGRFAAGAFEALRKFTELKKLTIGTRHVTDTESRNLATDFPNFLESLANQDKLTYLSMKANVPRPLYPHSLQNIQHIEIQADSTSIINVLGAGCFCTVVLRFTQTEFISTYTECFVSLVDTSSQVLQSLVVHSHAYSKHDFPVVRCLEPLLRARYLQKLCVYHSERLNITLVDDDLSKMVAAWPHLEQLLLQSSPWTSAGRDRRRQPTFLGITHLTKLPSLYGISIRAENISLDLQFPLCIKRIPNFNTFPSALRHHLLWISSRNKAQDTKE
ncbi:hypothetical protein CPB83DRAFT_900279 [Crepidotus variabilis]|uniref:F-box domain-containing protein n=1 Tax=Crepidotus variabilis TaxID=179855 RepID=A0A9P6E3F4_9AGAR|nr:hypothetical protein CPB83DRAFT_900279 [Crepidotus variabilis]